MTNFYVTTQRITLHLFHFLFYDRFIILFVTWNGAINVKVVDITSYSLAVLLIPINALLVFGMEDTHFTLLERRRTHWLSRKKKIICPFTSHHQEPTCRTSYHFHVEDNRSAMKASNKQSSRSSGGSNT